MQFNYATLREVKEQLNLLDSTDSDTLLQKWITRSSTLIEWYKGRKFHPYVKTIKLDSPLSSPPVKGGFPFEGFASASSMYVSETKQLFLPLDLLEVLSLKNGYGSEVEPTDFVLEPQVIYPKQIITLLEGSHWLLSDTGDIKQTVELEGVFGNVRNYPDCYVKSGDAVLNASGLLASETDQTIQVANPNGIPDDMLSPRFQTGQLLLVEPSADTFEFMVIKEITVNTSPTPSTISVVRGAFGTSPLVVPKDTVIKIFRVPEDISQICIRLVQWRYRQKDSDSFDRVFNIATQQVTTPSSLPVDVREILGQRKFSL